ncbi:Uncharacterised protein [uncultured archaeon]|nr:Uncharacterised protein [uncultured archaeon]
MSYSESEHGATVELALPAKAQKQNVDTLRLSLETMLGNGAVTPREMLSLIAALKSRFVPLDQGYDGKLPIHLTTDFDAVSLFPSQYPDWIEADGFALPQVVAEVQAAKATGRLDRLDLGGCMSALPGFRFDPTSNFPDFSLEQVSKFSKANGCENAEEPSGPGLDRRLMKKIGYRRDLLGGVSKRTIASICNYAVACYQQVLEAALFD